MKLSKGGSSGGHNGVADIMDKCGNDFARMRIGIGSKPDKRMDLADYVLGRLSSEDIAALRRIKFAECLTLLASKGLAAAQNEINRREAKASEPKADSKADGAEKISEGAAKAVSEEGETKKRGIISRLFGI